MKTQFLILVPDYHVTHPFQVDEDGNFFSHDLSNGNHRRRREVENVIKEPVFFHLSAFGQKFHLNVTLNDELLSPNFVVEVRGNQSSHFQFEIEHCHYTGNAVSSKGLGTKVAVSNCDGLVRKTKQLNSFLMLLVGVPLALDSAVTTLFWPLRLTTV